MFKFTRTSDGRSLNISTSILLAQYGDETITRELMPAIVSELKDMWVGRYGADLLDKISPEAVETEIKRAIAQRITKG